MSPIANNKARIGSTTAWLQYEEIGTWMAGMKEEEEYEVEVEVEVDVDEGERIRLSKASTGRGYFHVPRMR